MSSSDFFTLLSYREMEQNLVMSFQQKKKNKKVASSTKDPSGWHTISAQFSDKRNLKREMKRRWETKNIMK